MENYTDAANVVSGVHDFRPFKVFGISVSIFNLAVITPAIYSIIWFEKFGSNNIRTLINQFATAGCWTALAYNVLVQIPETLLSLFGPAGNPVLCHLHLLAKNALGIQYTLQVSAISIVKYVYIFVQKNPSGNHDDFWSFFVNLEILLFSALSQAVFQFLPGKNPYVFYMCANQTPKHSDKPKLNLPLQTAFLVSLFIYCFVFVKIRLYKLKSPSVAPVQGLPSSLGQILKSTLANFAVLAVIMLTVAPIIGISLVLNAAKFDQLGRDPYYHWVQVHQHLLPFFCTGFLVLSYFISHGNIREAVVREIKSHFSRL